MPVLSLAAEDNMTLQEQIAHEEEAVNVLMRELELHRKRLDELSASLKALNTLRTVRRFTRKEVR